MTIKNNGRAGNRGIESDSVLFQMLGGSELLELGASSLPDSVGGLVVVLAGTEVELGRASNSSVRIVEAVDAVPRRGSGEG